MPSASGVRFAGESQDYREARKKLLSAERKLRREVEKVAALRRALPNGHEVETDYEFEELHPRMGKPRKVRLSGLFELPRRSLVVYSFMFPKGGDPCPMCTAFLDSFNGAARHARGQVNLAVVGKAPIAKLAAWAKKRGWSHLRMLSSGSSDFNRVYLAETDRGSQLPMISVFRKTGGAVRHSYTTEIFFGENEPGQNPRHVDMVFPLWNLFDFTAEGRPKGYFPSLSD